MQSIIKKNMIEWKEIWLRELGELIMGQSPKGSSYNTKGNGIPLLNGAADFKDNKALPKQFTTKGTKLSKKGDILFCIRATIGKSILSDGVYCLGRGVAGFRVNEKILNKDYLLKIFDEKLDTLVLQGSTIRGVRGKDIGSLKILIPFFNGEPDLQEQEHIASILEKTEKQRERSKKAERLLDEYLKSVFNEMFVGEEVEEKGFLDIFNITTGKLDSNEMDENGKYPFFTCSQETYRINNYAFDCEALLLSGNNAAGIYSIKYYNGKFNAYQRTYVLTLKEKNNFRYLHFVLKDKLKDLRKLSIGTNTKYLTMGILKSIKIPLPPIATQQKFARIVGQVEKIKENVNKTKQNSEELFNSLIQKAFRGEL